VLADAFSLNALRIQMQRSQALQDFLAAMEEAFIVRTEAHAAAARAMKRVSAAIGVAGPPSEAPTPRTHPACGYLDAAIAGAMRGPQDTTRVAVAIKALAPALSWRLRPSTDATFTNGHASADILGATTESLEQRGDVRVGLSLLAPDITYPDHSHPPEEVYLALSRGYWRQEAKPWHEPGFGGIVYNPPGITHAMRSGPDPFLAIWCLPIDPAH